jgi:hypothetical protein
MRRKAALGGQRPSPFINPVNNNLPFSGGIDFLLGAWYNLRDNWIALRGRCGDEPPLLNKIIGCDSRTVPPLYIQGMLLLAKASHWETGKAEACGGRSSQLYESEDLHIGFSLCLRVYGQSALSQKNGCGTYPRCRSLIVF